MLTTIFLLLLKLSEIFCQKDVDAISKNYIWLEIIVILNWCIEHQTIDTPDSKYTHYNGSNFPYSSHSKYSYKKVFLINEIASLAHCQCNVIFCFFFFCFEAHAFQIGI